MLNDLDMGIFDRNMDAADALLDALLDAVGDDIFGMPDISSYDYMDPDFQGDGYDE